MNHADNEREKKNVNNNLFWGDASSAETLEIYLIPSDSSVGYASRVNLGIGLARQPLWRENPHRKNCYTISTTVGPTALWEPAFVSAKVSKDDRSTHFNANTSSSKRHKNVMQRKSFQTHPERPAFSPNAVRKS